MACAASAALWLGDWSRTSHSSISSHGAKLQACLGHTTYPATDTARMCNALMISCLQVSMRGHGMAVSLVYLEWECLERSRARSQASPDGGPWSVA